jgi:hypothetical protein
MGISLIMSGLERADKLQHTSLHNIILQFVILLNYQSIMPAHLMNDINFKHLISAKRNLCGCVT